MLNKKTETLKSALKVMSETAVRLKDVGRDDMSAELRATMSKMRRELNHLDAVKNHPDLFN